MAAVCAEKRDAGSGAGLPPPGKYLLSESYFSFSLTFYA